MNPELFTVIAVALRDATNGVNALRTALDPTLPAVTIVTAMEEAWAARNPLPEEKLAAGPVIIVRQADDYIVGASAQSSNIIADIPVLIGAAMQQSETHTGLYVVAQLLRTALRSIVLKFGASAAPSRLELNDVIIDKPDVVNWPLLQPSGETNVLLAAAIVPFPVYDPWAAGAYVAPPAP